MKHRRIPIGAQPGIFYRNYFREIRLGGGLVDKERLVYIGDVRFLSQDYYLISCREALETGQADVYRTVLGYQDVEDVVLEIVEVGGRSYLKFPRGSKYVYFLRIHRDVGHVGDGDCSAVRKDKEGNRVFFWFNCAEPDNRLAPPVNVALRRAGVYDYRVVDADEVQVWRCSKGRNYAWRWRYKCYEGVKTTGERLANRFKVSSKQKSAIIRVRNRTNTRRSDWVYLRCVFENSGYRLDPLVPRV